MLLSETTVAELPALIAEVAAFQRVPATAQDNTAAVMAHLKKEGIEADEKQVRRVLDPASVMLSYNSLGGTGPTAMAAISEEIHSTLDGHRAALEEDQSRVTKAYEACRAIAKGAGPKGENVKSAEDLEQLISMHRPGKGTWGNRTGM